MKSLQDYTIVIHTDDNNTFVAYIPAIPGCHAWGKTSDEASAELINVFQMIQEESNLEQQFRAKLKSHPRTNK